jgi:hypothetical protein
MRFHPQLLWRREYQHGTTSTVGNSDLGSTSWALNRGASVLLIAPQVLFAPWAGEPEIVVVRLTERPAGSLRGELVASCVLCLGRRLGFAPSPAKIGLMAATQQDIRSFFDCVIHRSKNRSRPGESIKNRSSKRFFHRGIASAGTDRQGQFPAASQDSGAGIAKSHRRHILVNPIDVEDPVGNRDGH